jgi:hypothetical protein
VISGLTALISLPFALAATGLLNFYGAYLFWRYLPMYSQPGSQEKRGDTSR